jgi:hypothetical protein
MQNFLQWTQFVQTQTTKKKLSEIGHLGNLTICIINNNVLFSHKNTGFLNTSSNRSSTPSLFSILLQTETHTQWTLIIFAALFLCTEQAPCVIHKW